MFIFGYQAIVDGESIADVISGLQRLLPADSAFLPLSADGKSSIIPQRTDIWNRYVLNKNRKH
jgi:hypothetical protein